MDQENLSDSGNEPARPKRRRARSAYRHDRGKAIIDQSGPLTAKKSYILGVLAGDGCLSGNYVGMCAGRDGDHALDFMSAIMDVFRINGTVYCFRSPATGRPLYDVRLYNQHLLAHLRSLATWGQYDWTVPEVVRNGSPEIKAAWIRGYADADGCVYRGNGSRCVHLDSVNKAGLDAVRDMLGELGIKVCENGGHRSFMTKRRGLVTEYRLTISFHEDLRRFAEVVGFGIRRKQRKLEKMIGSQRHFPSRAERRLARKVGRYQELLPKVRELMEKDFSYGRIAFELGVTRDVIQNTVDWARKNGRQLPERSTYQQGQKFFATGRKLGCNVSKVEDAIRLKEAGKSHQDIAEQLGFRNAQAVSNVLSWARKRAGDLRPGQSIPFGSNRKKPFSHEQLDALLPIMIQGRLDGKTLQKICDELGLNNSNVVRDTLIRNGRKDLTVRRTVART